MYLLYIYIYVYANIDIYIYVCREREAGPVPPLKFEALNPDFTLVEHAPSIPVFALPRRHAQCDHRWEFFLLFLGRHWVDCSHSRRRRRDVHPGIHPLAMSLSIWVTQSYIIKKRQLNQKLINKKKTIKSLAMKFTARILHMKRERIKAFLAMTLTSRNLRHYW